MKLFGRFNEMSINQIFLYGAPDSRIEEIIQKYPTTEVIIKERKLRPIYKKYQDSGQNEEIYQIDADPTRLHKVILKQDLGFMKVEIHSYGMSAEMLRQIDLKPIPELEKKEYAGRAIQRLNDGNNQRKVKKVKGKYVKV